MNEQETDGSPARWVRRVDSVVDRPDVTAPTVTSLITPSRTRPAPTPAGVAHLQRLAGNAAVAATFGRPGRGPTPPAGPTVQREVNKKGTFVGWGGTNDGNVMVNANASVDVFDGARLTSHPAWFISTASEAVDVVPGASGTVTIRLPWYWHHHAVVQEPGRIYGTNERHIRVGGGPIDYWVAAPFTVTPEGKVAFTAALPGGILGAAGYLEGVPTITPTGGDGSGTVTVNVTFKALQSTTTTDTATRTTTGTGSGGVTGTAAPGGVGGSVTGGASYGVSESNAHAVGMSLTGATAVSCSFAITLRVKVPPKIVKQKTISYDAEGKFTSGNDGIRGVNEWWSTIPPAVRELIIAGKKPVRIAGRASQTGSAERNELVIARRIEDVRARLMNVAGRMDIMPNSDFTGANERSVVIWTEYTQAEETAGGAPSSATR